MKKTKMNSWWPAVMVLTTCPYCHSERPEHSQKLPCPSCRGKNLDYNTADKKVPIMNISNATLFKTISNSWR